MKIDDYRTYRCNDCEAEMEYICQIFECDECGSSDIELIED